MWKLAKKPRSVLVTRKLCEEFRDMEAAPGDRDFRAKRGVSHKAAILGKCFRPCLWAKVYCKETKKVYRVNGKHTSTVMSELNGETRGLYVTIQEYEADTLLDVSQLYSTFDSRETIRSTWDVIKSYAHAIPEVCDLPASSVRLATSAMTIGEWGWNVYHNKSADDRAKLLTDEGNKPFVIWIDSMLRGVPNEDRAVVKKVPVAVAMYKTWLKDRKAADEFWRLVRDGSGPDRTSPDRKLNKFLLTAKIANSRITVLDRTKHPTTNHEIYCKCLTAWRAWRRGEQTNLKYYPNAKEPAVV